MGDESDEGRSSHDRELWQGLVASRGSFDKACEIFLQEASDPLNQLRQGCRGSVPEVLTALGVLRRLNDDDQKKMFLEILRLCTIIKFARIARSLVLAMPRKWIIENIQLSADNLLRAADNIEYSLVLALFESLDIELAVQFAEKAAAHDDYDIREVGLDFLKKIGR